MLEMTVRLFLSMFVDSEAYKQFSFPSFFFFFFFFLGGGGGGAFVRLIKLKVEINSLVKLDVGRGGGERKIVKKEIGLELYLLSAWLRRPKHFSCEI